MKSIFLLLILLNAAAVNAASFIDKADFPTWAEKAIDLVNDQGIMTGYGDGHFGPNEFLTRAEAVTLISRLRLDIINDYNGVPRFPDVIQGTWYDQAIGIAANHGWIRGHDDGYFYPGNSLTRAEFAAMLSRAFALKAENTNLAADKFRDVDVHQWFTASVSAMLEQDLLRNKLSLNYAPGKAVSRAEAAWTFATLVNKPGLTGAAGEAVYDVTDPLNSRRVAIKPRDFNANNQGYNIQKAAINVKVTPMSETEPIKFGMESAWQQLGLIRFTNTFDYQANLDAFRVRLRLDANDMGPKEGFMLRFEGPEMDRQIKVYSNGEVAVTGLNYRLEPEDELVIKVSIKPDSNESFFSQIATGKVFIMEATGQAYKEFVNQSRDHGVRVAPIEYETRDLSKFEFDPAKTPTQ